MDFTSILLLISFVVASVYLLKHGQSRRLPPGPTGFPVIGNLLHIGKLPHQSLTNLSKTYGPIISLKLGSITTIVISSSEIAKQVFQKHDQALSSRTLPDSTRALDHHRLSVAWLPASSRWRQLRKISAVHLFSSQRLDASQALREQKVHQLIEYVRECCARGKVVRIGTVGFITVLNLISNTMFSIDMATYYDDSNGSSRDYKDLVRNIMEEGGKPNISDCFPAVRFMDPQGVRKRVTVHALRLFAVFDDIIDERRRLRSLAVDRTEPKDVLDILLNLHEEKGSDLSLDLIKHLLLDFFSGGSDTMSSTLEWAMAELLHNPETFAKARIELEQVLTNKREVQESDISNLPYLQAIFKETFRLHPPVPLLLPRKAEKDTELCGFIVPQNSQFFVNVWAIGRDPSTWSDPDVFSPERFLNNKIDVKGRDYELLPFGAGRRICPGLPLAQRMLPVMLASLIQSFDWELEDKKRPKDMDMSDKFGISLHKAKPLRVIPIKL